MNTEPSRRYPSPLLGVSGAALAFAVLLVIVRLQWAPVESVDHGLADRLNSFVAPDHVLVAVLKQVSWLGSGGVLWTLVVATAVVMAIRRQWRLAVYVLVAGAGSLVLDPVLKSLVGRVRPVVAHPVAYGTGDSFPSGHALGSLVCYGAILLVFLPALHGRWQTALRWVVLVLVTLIGISRLMLGVHYLSDVLGGWALGITWLGLTAYAFEVARRRRGEQPVPLSQGLEPEAAADVTLTEPEPPATHGHPARIAAGVATAWVLICGAVIGIGKLVLSSGKNVLGDTTIPHWLAAHRTASLNTWSEVTSQMGATEAILLIAIATCVVSVAILRRWRPVIFVAALMVGELAMFLVAEYVVRRPRPDVPNMDHHLPTFAYPSGHVAATVCVWAGLSILLIGHARGWWRWLILIPAILMPVLVIASRLYRGEHHPTDVLGSLLFAALWIPALVVLIRPNADAHEPAPALAWRRRTTPKTVVAQ